MAEIKYYGLESHFNENVTFYKDVNIQGNLNYDSLIVRNLTVREQSILGTVKVSSGIVTATSGITTYYGDGNNLIVSGSTLPNASLSAQIVNLEALITTGVPSGVIVMWSGTIANIPTGWALSNGSNGTPDLRNRFIVGAGSDTLSVWGFNKTTGASTFTGGQSYVGVGSTGGNVGVALTIGEMPAHTHSGGATYPGSGTEQNQSGGPEDYTTFNVNTGSAGGNEYHENRPPYYALAFIMKT